MSSGKPRPDGSLVARSSASTTSVREGSVSAPTSSETKMLRDGYDSREAYRKAGRKYRNASGASIQRLPSTSVRRSYTESSVDVFVAKSSRRRSPS